MLIGNIKCSTLTQSLGLFVKVIHLTQQKGLYFEMDLRGLIVLPWKNCIFGSEAFYYISEPDASRFSSLNFQN